jgi:hypothetical protein
MRKFHKKTADPEWLGICGSCATRLCEKGRREGKRLSSFVNYAIFRDVGSLAGSAASGHKSRVALILFLLNP